MVRAKGGDASRGSCCLLLSCFASLLEPPPWLHAFGLSLDPGNPWALALEDGTGCHSTLWPP